MEGDNPQESKPNNNEDDQNQSKFELDKKLILEIWSKVHLKLKEDHKLSGKSLLKSGNTLIHMIGKRMYNRALSEQKNKRKVSAMGLQKKLNSTALKHKESTGSIRS